MRCYSFGIAYSRRMVAAYTTINRKMLFPMSEKNGCCCHYSYHHFCSTLNPFCSVCYSSSSVIIVLGNENRKDSDHKQEKKFHSRYKYR
jgi:hypothetical protein